jgi:ribulose-5-phosphate 4-epimerase/fuculose-1-phosphate aldolase
VNYSEEREQMVELARSLYDRGYGCGSSGNLSLRLPEGLLITPTNSSLGRLRPADLALISEGGEQRDGKQPSKELFLHQAVYRERPQEQAIVHLHSTYSVAVSCLDDVSPEDVLPPLTAYYVMRVGQLPLAPYFPPGDLALADAVGELAKRCRAMLLANHGSVVAGNSLEQAVYAAEELEEAAKLFLLLRGQAIRPLTTAQVAELQRRFPS